jgi:hypothetical protein
MLFVTAGTLSSILLLYIGMQKAATFEKSPFWFYIAANAINTIVVSIVASLVANSMVGGALSSFF